MYYAEGKNLAAVGGAFMLMPLLNDSQQAAGKPKNGKEKQQHSQITIRGGGISK